MLIKKNTKALSPIFAVLILIAITVIAGIVVYMFTSGYLATMMGGGTAGQEKAAIQSVTGSAGTGVTIYAQWSAGGPINITNAILRDADGKTKATIAVPASTLLTDATGLVTIGPLKSADFVVVEGSTYTVALVSQNGNQFVSASFKAGA